MDPNLYAFGSRLARRYDFYSFPRTGSHYLWTCLTGLLDLVFFPTQFATDPEAMQRAEELNPLTFYMMKLREDGIPFEPVYINPEPNGTHGLPQLGDWPAIILIRNPHPTIYSWYYTATERWNVVVPDRVAWMRDAYRQYAEFYDRALEMKRTASDYVMIVRFEELKKDASELRRLVNFFGVRSKLTPEFVHWATNFDRMTKEGKRTFFRGGNNQRWKEDEGWMKDLTAIQPPDFSRFGYSDGS